MFGFGWIVVGSFVRDCVLKSGTVGGKGESRWGVCNDVNDRWLRNEKVGPCTYVGKAESGLRCGTVVALCRVCVNLVRGSGASCVELMNVYGGMMMMMMMKQGRRVRLHYVGGGGGGVVGADSSPRAGDCVLRRVRLIILQAAVASGRRGGRRPPRYDVMYATLELESDLCVCYCCGCTAAKWKQTKTQFKISSMARAAYESR